MRSRLQAAQSATQQQAAWRLTLVALPAQEQLTASVAAGEVREGVLEAALQELQGARRTPLLQTQQRSHAIPVVTGARRRSAPPDEVLRLEALARAIGMAIERARLPPAALLLNELLQMQARLRAASHDARVLRNTHPALLPRRLRVRRLLQ